MHVLQYNGLVNDQAVGILMGKKSFWSVDKNGNRKQISSAGISEGNASCVQICTLQQMEESLSLSCQKRLTMLLFCS